MPNSLHTQLAQLNEQYEQALAKRDRNRIRTLIDQIEAVENQIATLPFNPFDH